ncbi:hypothetical protein BH09BAC2_BH09BAC2_16480 [soil metagenome]
MKYSLQPENKIYTTEKILPQLNVWKLLGKKIVFTNGVFDIIHLGHLKLLSKAASFADILIVGINSDASVKRLKGEGRPLNDENTRALMIASLFMTDAVIIFDEDTPLNLIKIITPDILVKGGDYTIETIVGAKEVVEKGGEIKIISLEEGLSTSNIIKKIKHQ